MRLELGPVERALGRAAGHLVAVARAERRLAVRLLPDPLELGHVAGEPLGAGEVVEHLAARPRDGCLCFHVHAAEPYAGDRRGSYPGTAERPGTPLRPRVSPYRSRTSAGQRSRSSAQPVSTAPVLDVIRPGSPIVYV